MMGGWNLHIQELYVLDYQLLSKETGGGGGGGRLRPSCPASVASWELLVGH